MNKTSERHTHTYIYAHTHMHTHTHMYIWKYKKVSTDSIVRCTANTDSIV